MDSLVISNIRQRPLRSAISVVGVALGVTLVMIFTGLAHGMSDDLQKRSANVRAEIIFTRPGTMTGATFANLSTKYVELLKQVDGVEDATPVIRAFYPSGSFGVDQVEGVEWESFSRMNNVRLIQGRAPQALDEVVIDETKAFRNHHPVGSTVKLYGDKDYRVVGVYSPESGARAKLSLEAMQNALEAPGKCSYILIKCKDPNQQIAVARQINEKLPGNSVQFTREFFPSIETAFPALKVFLRVLVALAAVVSALVIMLAMHTTITERTREIGILKAMGASRTYIISEIEREALLISFFGLLVGFALALVAGFAIHKVTGLVFEFGTSWSLVAAAIGLGGGAIGAFYPAARAANLDPVNALAYE